MIREKSIGRLRRRMITAAMTAMIAIGFAADSRRSVGQVSTHRAGEANRDETKELSLKITAPFTLAMVGDIIEPEPVGDREDPGYQQLISIIRGADVGFANMEASLSDMSHFKGPLAGTMAPKEVAATTRAMGIRIVNRANNHTLNGGIEGMLSTDAALDEVGIVHSGTGKDLEEARAAHFLDTPKGRVGLVGMFSVDDPSYSTSEATYRLGNLGGRPGLNALRLNRYNVVTQTEFDSLREIRDAVYARRSEVANPIDPLPANAPADQLELFGSLYKVGEKTGDFSYSMNPSDLRDILRSIRSGKYYSDFMIVTIHTHQNDFAFQHYSFDHTTPAFLVELAHKCIDNGADVFVAHGVHTLRGVEIYHNKPIFYGISNFVFQVGLQIQENPDAYLGKGDNPFTTEMTEAQANEKGWAWLQKPDNLETVLATSRYEGGRLVEVRLYPVDLGQGANRPISRMGIPLTPSPEMTHRVLEELQTLSKPFGTTIAIEGNVGVIHLVSDMEISPGASEHHQ
jgi:poly-gamma-glutamate capsule biosynthesis protein CapA/YwtB (metallophosphatase superfamily)